MLTWYDIRPIANLAWSLMGARGVLIWPQDVSTMRVHLTTGLCDHSSHTHGHKMSLPGECQVDILFDRQSANQPACQLQLASHPAMWQIINLSGFGLIREFVARQRAQPHWAPLQGPSTTTGSPWGVTYLTKARQVTQMSSAAHHIPMELHSGTICSFVSMLPNHIFLHAIEKCYMDYVLSRPIYSYPSTTNLMY